MDKRQCKPGLASRQNYYGSFDRNIYKYFDYFVEYFNEAIARLKLDHGK